MCVELMRCGTCERLWDRDEVSGSTCPSVGCGGTCETYDDDYADRCPRCGGTIELRSCAVATDTPVGPDGWSFSDCSFLDTSEEMFGCHDCGAAVPAEWVFRDVTRKQAIAMMAGAEQPAGESQEFRVELAATRIVYTTVTVQARSMDEAHNLVHQRYLGPEATDSLGDLDWKSGDLETDKVVIVCCRRSCLDH